MAVWPDLSGHALPARQWGRIGTQGRVRLDPHPGAGAALNAPARLARANGTAPYDPPAGAAHPGERPQPYERSGALTRVRQGRHAAAKAVISEFVRRYGWPVRAAERPLCIGHRGACAYANENTLAAFRVAARLGAEMWELDARLSRDGVVVVCHDDAVTAADGRRMLLSAHDAADIAQIPLRGGGAVPALQEVIDLAIETGCGLYVEIKERAAALPALRLLSASAVPFAAVGSFDHDTVRDLVAARPEHPRFPVSVLVRVGEDPFAAAADTGAEVVHLCWERASDAPDRLVTPALIARAAIRATRGADLARGASRCARSAADAPSPRYLYR